MIEKLDIDMMPEASRLIWKSFYRAEKDNFSLEGMELFRDMTQPPVLQLEILKGTTHFWGRFENGELIGVLALRKNRIVLLFVREDSQRRGIGTELVRFAAGICQGELLTVDSSPSSVEFYKKLGFVPSGPLSGKGNIISMPMQARRERLSLSSGLAR